MSALLIALLGATLPLVAPGDSAPSDEGPTLRWVFDGERMGVEVLGLDPANLADLGASGHDPASWPSLLTVGVDSAAEPLRPIAGRYRVEGSALRFEPAFPTDRDVALVARLDPSRLPRPGVGPIRSARVALRRPPQPPSTRVARVDPAAEVVPENLLKFYLHFNAPMSQGEAYRRVQILDEMGQPVDRPFLEVGEELWDAAGTRLTLLLDPGRIKRGLVPHDEEGPILQAGRSYTLVVDRNWPDAEGRPLVDGFRQAFRAGPADRDQPDPRTWTVDPPIAGTRGPLTLGFPEPLDQAMLATALVVLDPDGRPITGRVVVGGDGRGWSFEPATPWRAGDFQVVVNPELEDLAGNSVARPFEVDVAQPAGPPGNARSTIVPFAVRERRPAPR